MIRAFFDHDDLTVEVKGHAGSQGKDDTYDIVCCAASFAAQSLLYNIEQYRDRHSGIRIEKQIEPGYMKMHIIAKDWARAPIHRMMEYAETAFQMLEDNYSAFVQVTREDHEEDEDG